MKKLLSIFFLCALFLLCGISAYAADDSGMWEYASYDSGVELTAYNGTQTDVYVPSNIKVDGESLPVIKLGDGLFADNTGINSVTLGEGITEIGEGTFQNATNLVCIVTPESLTTIGANAFSGCANFNSVILYDAVESIGENAFEGCDKLTIYCTSTSYVQSYVTSMGLNYKNIDEEAEPEIYTVDGIEYYIMSGEAYITSVSDDLISVTVPATIKGYPVTDIRDAFKNHSLLETVVLPDSIKTMHSYAFYNCPNIINIHLPKSLLWIEDFAFALCRNISAINIPEGVISIGNNAFSNCSNLINIQIPENVMNIGENAFSNCEKLANITISESVTSIGDYAFNNCTALESIIIPSSIEVISKGMFSNCTNLKFVTMTDNVISIRSYAFERCSSITNINIPNNIDIIEEYTFYYCSNLSSITLPNKITEIGESAFSNCYGLAKIDFPENLTTIKRSAFYDCSSLMNVELPNSVNFIGSTAFASCDNLVDFNMPAGVKTIESQAFAYCKSLTNIVLPEGISELASGVFENCQSLTNIDVPNNVVIIGEGAFKNCIKFKNITFQENVKTIEREAFFNCSSLESISIPDSVTTIETQAFDHCNKIYDVILSSNITSIGELAFPNTTLLCVYKDSYAYTYAVNNNYAYYVIKDGQTPRIFVVDGITYVVEEDSLNILAVSKELTQVTVPSLVNGYVVKSVGISFRGNKVVQEIVLPSTITSIVDYAFLECSSLKSIVIPNSVKSIGEYAFANCVNLLSITIPDSVTRIGKQAFYKCSNLSNVKLSEKLTVVGLSVFMYCTSLTNITIPDSVTEIGGYAFYSCTSLADVTLPENLNSIVDYAFSGCKNLNNITIPDSVTSIGQNAFAGCSSLAELKLSPRIVSISMFCFEGCKGLKNIIIPDGIKYIGYCAFGNCTALETVQLSNSVTSIGDYAFRGCSKLKNISFPEKLETIGSYAFSYCGNLQNVTLNNGLNAIKDYAFLECSNLENIQLPNSVTSISEGAFSKCSRLQSIVLPENIMRINPYTFSSCSSLENITLNNKIDSIGKYAFSKCSALITMQLPDSITSIEEGAFSGCSNLSSFILSDNTVTIQNLTFENCVDLRFITVPESVNSIVQKSFAPTTILCVYENSYAHNFAVENDLLYFILHKTSNPEISYGQGITGTVTYTDGTYASNATVDILYDDGTVKETVKTDANGNYEFTYAEVGRYTIRVTDSKGNTASEIVSVKRMNVFNVYLAGETDLVLRKGYNVAGTVTPATAKITLSDTNGNTITSVDTTNGEFAFSDVPRGSYIVKAENETGSAMTEIYVSNEDVTDIFFEIKAQSASISGNTNIENRDGTYTTKVWVNIDLIDSDGNVVARTTTDENGAYTFENVPAGSYKIVATTNEIRPDIIGGFDKSHELKGYGHIDVTEFITYTVDTIILREDKINLTSVSGKVTANGITQDCQVILTNENGDQIAVFVTDKNGKYNFVNIPDGMYCITAITKVDGMGSAVITIENGVVHGDTDIKVAKADKISKREPVLLSIPDCDTKAEAILYKEAVMAEKDFYDSLSEKERKQLSEEWTEKLFKLVGLISDSNIQSTEGVTVENIESVIPSDEIDEEITFALTVTEATATDAGEDGITTDEEYETEKIKDKKGKNKKIAKYYDITFAKDGQNISNIRKQTETNGKLRITMEIPEEYRGHRHYSFIHMHNGEAVTLVDLDDDPNTVTFEIDKFSTFALAYSDVELTGEIEGEEEPEIPTPELVAGDANGDGEVDFVDAVVVLKHDAGVSILSGDNLAAADTNGDEEVDFVDAIQILKYDCGLISAF